MNKWKKWELWGRLRNWCQKRMESAWMEGGNCDSKCPRCKQQESHGNIITTKSLDDGSESRSCEGCGHKWRAIFTPAGFVPVDP